MSDFKSYHERVAKAQIIVKELLKKKFSEQEIVKVVFESTQLGKRWVENYIEILEAVK